MVRWLFCHIFNIYIYKFDIVFRSSSLLFFPEIYVRLETSDSPIKSELRHLCVLFLLLVLVSDESVKSMTTYCALFCKINIRAFIYLFFLILKHYSTLRNFDK